MFRIPNSVGLIVNFQFGKMLRQLPNHIFGLAPWPGESGDLWFCPVHLLEDYVQFKLDIQLEWTHVSGIPI